MVVNIILPANANNINKKEENLYNFKDLSIIMPSYDKYSELWNPAFEIFFKYWSSLNNKYSKTYAMFGSKYRKDGERSCCCI